MASVFSEISPEQWLIETDHFFVINDKYPVSPGHLLIVSKRECRDFFDLTLDEREELPEVILMAKEWINRNGKPDGYNIGINCGEAAGQTVFHFHCHVIPRWTKDTPNPRGGVRNVIEGMGDY